MRLRPLVVSSRKELEEEMRKIGVDEVCSPIFLEKKDSFLLKITGITTPAANILKQTALSLGADVAVHREVITGKIERSDALYMGTRRQLRKTAQSLSGQPFGLARLEEDVSQILERLDAKPQAMRLPRGKLSFVHPIVMGVLNITPDSFSDGGKYLEPEAACGRIEQILSEGADIIDVGAESTRPGSEPVPVSDQLSRLEPVFDYFSGKNIIWSVDTTHPDVARRGLDCGASLLNDTSAGSVPVLWELTRGYSAAYVLMHSQGSPKVMQDNPHYEDFSAELYDFFCEKLTAIEESGFSRQRVIIDPGIGFGKRVEDNSAAIRRLGELKAFGVPILVGASRKSFLGTLLNLDVNERLEASLASAVLALSNGAHILRVHDVAETRRAVDATAKIREFSSEAV